MNNQKKRQHKFVEKFPVFAAILMAIFGMILFEILELIINLGIHEVIDGYSAGTGPVGLFGGAVITMALYKWWFRPEFEGMLKGDLRMGFLLGLIELAYLLISFIPEVMTKGGLDIKPLTWTIIFISLTAGIKEEFLFRGVIISTLMRQWKDRNMFRQAALASGIIFGLIHALNVFAGADPIQTILQVVSSMAFGFIFAAVYMRTGSLLPCMFYHALHDIIAIAGESNVSEDGIMSAAAIGWSDGFNILLSVALTAVAFWLLRDARTEQLREVWDRKWKLEAAPAPAEDQASSAGDSPESNQ